MMTRLFRHSEWSTRQLRAVFLPLFVVVLLSSCAGVGPKTVARDRFDYVTAISDSWKRQTLMNMLKTRYADAPVLMDVTSVINQYAVESQVQLAASWANKPLTDTQSVGGSAKYTDRPTITLIPPSPERSSQRV